MPALKGARDTRPPWHELPPGTPASDGAVLAGGSEKEDPDMADSNSDGGAKHTLTRREAWKLGGAAAGQRPLFRVERHIH